MKPKPKKLSKEELDKIVDNHCVYDALGDRHGAFYKVRLDFKKLFGHIAVLKLEIK